MRQPDPSTAGPSAGGTGAAAAAAANPAGDGAVAAAVPAARRSRLLLRGESAVASVGISLAAILLAVMAGSSWWMLQSQRSAWEASRREQATTVANLVSQTAEAMLAHDEVTAVRRMVADLGTGNDLQCRIVLSDGHVFASADPTEIDIQTLPQTWDRNRTADDALTEPAEGTFAVGRSMTIPGRGSADLEVVATLSQPLWNYWETQTGVGGIGAVALALLWLVYRRTRRGLRAMGAVREALLLAAAGETSASALAVADSLGPEAAAWNEIIAARDRQALSGVAERAREALGRRGHAKGDLSAACDVMSQGLLLVDERSRVTYANGAAAVFLQAPRERLNGADVASVVAVPKVLAAIREICAGNGGGRRRTVLDVERKADAGRAGVFRFTVRPVRREDSAAAMVTIEDITQQRVADEARNAFVAQATHELRTPLTNIRLYVETAIEDGENDPAMRAKALNVINGETRRLERIVGEMLSVAEIEAGSFKLKVAEVRLETVFEELEFDYQQQAKDKRITLDLNLPPKLPAIRGDRDKIMLALHNLVGNALKYTPDGGRVTVTAEVTDKHLTVVVSDTGIGIAPDDADRIFERFYRAKDPRVSKVTGTGLGLTIAREVVRLHGGDIGVESQLNKGSAFTLTLPVKAEAA